MHSNNTVPPTSRLLTTMDSGTVVAFALFSNTTLAATAEMAAALTTAAPTLQLQLGNVLPMTLPTLTGGDW